MQGLKMQNQNNQMPNTPNSQMDDDEINLMDILLVIAKYNRFIIIFTLISAALAFVYALRQPVLYTANVLIMPPKAPMSQTGVLLGQLSSMGLGSGSGSGSLGPTIAILANSQKLGYQMVERLNLISLYKTKDIESARNILQSATNIKTNKDGTILIECSDRNPKIAALLANSYIDELDKLNSTIAVTSAARTRLFYEKQIKLANETLAKIEIAMVESQVNANLTPFEAQNGGMASLISVLRGQITSKELDLASMKSYMTEQNPQYRKAVMSLMSLKTQLEKLERVDDDRKKDIRFDNKLTNAGSSLLNNIRDLEAQKSLIASLRSQYEVAKLDEAKDPSLIQVINNALVPDQPSKPRRGLIIASASLVGMILAMVLAFIINAYQQNKQNPVSAERLNLIRRYFLLGR